MDKDFITLEESKDQLIGKVGTPKRDEYEEELRLYAIGAESDVCHSSETFQGNEYQC